VGFAVQQGKTYYLKASSWLTPLQGLSRAGAYALTFRTDKTAPDDYGNDFATAFNVFLNAFGGATLSGKIETETDVDFFTFQATKTGNMNVSLTMPPGSMLDAGLYTYNDLKLSLDAGTGLRFLTLFVEQGKRYYVKVAPKPFPPPGLVKTGAYTLNLNMANGMGGNQTVDFNNAQQLTLDAGGAAKASGQLDNEWSAKLFRFQATKNGLMVVEVAPGFGSKLAGNLTIYDGGKLPISPVGEGRFREFMVTSGNTYSVRVTAHPFPPLGAQKTGAFALSVRTEAIQPDDYGNDFNTAHEVLLSPTGTATVSGRIETLTDQDFFRVKAGDNGWLDVQLQFPLDSRLDGRITAYDEEKREQKIPFPVQKGQYYYVKVYRWNPPLYDRRATGGYTLSWKFTNTLPDDFGNTFATAHVVKLFNTGPTTRLGRIETGDDVDFFRFQATATGNLEIALKRDLGSRLNGHLFVYDENQTLIKDTNQGFNRLVHVAVQGGKTYYVKVAATKDAIPSEKVGWYVLEIRPLPNKGSNAAPSPRPRAEVANDGGVLAHLVAELLVHADDQGVGGLDVAQGYLETLPDLGRGADAAAGGQHLVDQARLAGRLDHLEHLRRVGRQVDLAQG
jgi:hypothetical protein